MKAMGDHETNVEINAGNNQKFKTFPKPMATIGIEGTEKQ